MTTINYRQAITEGIARAMRRDERVVFLGEDVGEAGGAFKSTVGLIEEFGPGRVWDTPISEQAIIGAAMGAAMNGLRPIAEIMFSDFLSVCWDGIANEIAKARYMTGGQLEVPLVIRTHNGAGMGFGAQHSQSLENMAMMVPGLKVVAPSNPADLVGLLASAVDDPDPVLFFEHKNLFNDKGEVPDGDHCVPLGRAAIVRPGTDVTIVSLAAMVPVALEAAEALGGQGVSCEVLDLRCLAPLDLDAIVASVEKTSRLVVVEENPRACGWGAEIASLVVEHAFWSLDGPIMRITGAPVPVPFAANLEAAAIPSAAGVVEQMTAALASA
ncbi:MAG TPA: alpha-ketoacid dehydrogenase subunit beta [Acidimicrobiales bacterium]|nr:alpha-ketoacid dehydrogenase subunit beta [Acidimicrobiales bacterium]